ncbi:threonylcarbamoyl-AMP synthase [Candidatus Falkowbacteria bacterium CG10_big_fil_rev_8_21_14_0_10_43_11]|uniref:L-threonylcarbamoyladenylate synthase n=1 Tax=Candidatus Falkowbacteria bacterium CG10_big_fil_rev_8_21_14_0_10_43_11 TaxID=1974568 RepID=A0A2M6WLC3_9BACT|nr:MAG: threonylcarbamoyl-AMP synthase [Candidatus Falkowbacteria bacterium CG10_big_fil_rev_8_21_14_0_10_43_11]
MKIVKIDFNFRRSKIIKEITEELKRGKIIVYPTETFYGLGCDATNARAVKKIYQIKGRAENKALPFLVCNLAMARKYLEFNGLAKQLAKQYWSGPLSLVLPFNVYGRKFFKHSINSKNFDGGVRISSNKLATLLVKKLGKPLISTSANLSNQPSTGDVPIIINYFKNKKYQPDIIIDAGKLPLSLGSTFLDARSGEIKILRQGDLKISKKFLKL